MSDIVPVGAVGFGLSAKAYPALMPDQQTPITILYQGTVVLYPGKQLEVVGISGSYVTVKQADDRDLGRDLSDEELDAAIDRSGWPQNMISDFVRDKLREACRSALAAAAGKLNPKVNSGGIHGKS